MERFLLLRDTLWVEVKKKEHQKSNLIFPGYNKLFAR